MKKRDHAAYYNQKSNN